MRNSGKIRRRISDLLCKRNNLILILFKKKSGSREEQIPPKY